MGNSLLTIQNLSAWYFEDRKVLSNVSLELADHEVVGLIGLNGAGKTTFIKTLSGLLDSFQVEAALWQGKSLIFRNQKFKKNGIPYLPKIILFNFLHFVSTLPM